MAKNSNGLWLYAIGEVQRPHINREQPEDGSRRPLQVLSAGSVFEAEDEKQHADLIRLLAARVATEDEIALEEDRREREGEEDQGTEIVASVPQGDSSKSRAPRAEQAPTTPPKSKTGKAKPTGESADEVL